MWFFFTLLVKFSSVAKIKSTSQRVFRRKLSIRFVTTNYYCVHHGLRRKTEDSSDRRKRCGEIQVGTYLIPSTSMFSKLIYLLTYDVGTSRLLPYPIICVESSKCCLLLSDCEIPLVNVKMRLVINNLQVANLKYLIYYNENQY